MNPIEVNLKENPDMVNNMWEYNDDDAIPFGYYRGMFVLGNPSKTHGESMKQFFAGSWGNRELMEFAGRAWFRPKVISFWGKYPTPTELDKIFKDLEKVIEESSERKFMDSSFDFKGALPINKSDWKIEVPPEGTESSWDDEHDFEAGFLFAIDDYTGHEGEHEDVDHAVSPMKKGQRQVPSGIGSTKRPAGLTQTQIHQMKTTTDEILREWCFRLPKGYPTMDENSNFTDGKELFILNEIFSEFQQKNVIEEAMNDDEFDNLISSRFGKNIPSAKGKYVIPNKTSELRIDPNDVSNFSKLFPIRKGTAIGPGEVALYWLFNYNINNKGRIKVATTDTSNEADLRIKDVNVEVKSGTTAKHTVIGKFGTDKENRIILNRVLGISNLITILTPNKATKKIFSEDNLYPTDIIEAFELSLQMKHLFENTEFKTLVSKYELFQTLQKHIETVIDKQIKETPMDQAANLIKKIIINKIESKPGHKGVIAKAISDDTIKIYYVDINKLNSIPSEVFIKSEIFRINSTRVLLNLDLVF